MTPSKSKTIALNIEDILLRITRQRKITVFGVGAGARMPAFARKNSDRARAASRPASGVGGTGSETVSQSGIRLERHAADEQRVAHRSPRRGPLRPQQRQRVV